MPDGCASQHHSWEQSHLALLPGCSHKDQFAPKPHIWECNITVTGNRQHNTTKAVAWWYSVGKASPAVAVKGLFSLITLSSAHWTGSSIKLGELTWTLWKPDKTHTHSDSNYFDVCPFHYLAWKHQCISKQSLHWSWCFYYASRIAFNKKAVLRQPQQNKQQGATFNWPSTLSPKALCGKGQFSSTSYKERVTQNERDLSQLTLRASIKTEIKTQVTGEPALSAEPRHCPDKRGWELGKLFLCHLSALCAWKTAGHPKGLWHKQGPFRYGKTYPWWSLPHLCSPWKAWHRVCRNCEEAPASSTYMWAKEGKWRTEENPVLKKKGKVLCHYERNWKQLSLHTNKEIPGRGSDRTQYIIRLYIAAKWERIVKNYTEALCL